MTEKEYIIEVLKMIQENIHNTGEENAKDITDINNNPKDLPNRNNDINNFSGVKYETK